MNQIPPEPTSQTSQNTSGAQVHPPEPVSQQLPPVDPKPSNPIPRVQKLQMKLGNQEKRPRKLVNPKASNVKRGSAKQVNQTPSVSKTSQKLSSLGISKTLYPQDPTPIQSPTVVNSDKTYFQL